VNNPIRINSAAAEEQIAVPTAQEADSSTGLGLVTGMHTGVLRPSGTTGPRHALHWARFGSEEGRGFASPILLAAALSQECPGHQTASRIAVGS
jgi:hypothetical protein